ncbi:MAG: serine/threonine protein phosphatase [Ignavibacteriae bacterium HGW-Ignavibacteriae-1]|jgi:serine/threonine protein phosphatase 1|nr:MAG: serine/threonine protein phosphatase [Ignavibacteriae bacterium HGW-Ignavibacteriae-1]
MSETGRTIVIGDVHGCSNTLDKLLDDVCEISKADTLIFLGDYIDRGPNSKAVVDRILNLRKAGYEVITLKGNHEQMLIDAINQPKSLRNWLRNGAQSTLDDFEIMSSGFLDDEYLDFFLNLKMFHLTDDFAITHAGFNFDIKNPYSDFHAMLWSRPSKINREKIGDRRMLVGHTPTPISAIKESLHNDIIRLDGGCVYHRQVKDLGYLCAFDLISKELFYTENCELE